MAGSACAGPAAQAPHIEAMLAYDLHNPPSFDGIENVADAIRVDHFDCAHNAFVR
jgi:hypothetical protein